MTETMKRIKQELQTQGLSNANFARRTGFTEAAICRWMKGQRDPKIKDVEKMAEDLGLKVLLFK